MTITKPVWVAYTNTDCTEGRGHDVPIAVCEIEATAQRLSKRKYVQGTDGPIRDILMVKMDGVWYVPLLAINIVEPTIEDTHTQHLINSRRAAIAKAAEVGMTDAEIKAIMMKL